MIAPKSPPIVPPTTAVCCLSILQTSALDVAVALKGEPVETAVAATRVGSEVAEAETVVDVWDWNAATEDVVTFGAVALLQQLRRSLIARQQ